MKTAPDGYNAIVIGAGHNGLICAAYLARAGRRVLVLERRHVLGGAAVSEELYPGFTFSVASYVVSLLRPRIIRELELARYGYRVVPMECSFQPLEGTSSLARWSDTDRTPARNPPLQQKGRGNLPGIQPGDDANGAVCQGND